MNFIQKSFGNMNHHQDTSPNNNLRNNHDYCILENQQNSLTKTFSLNSPYCISSFMTKNYQPSNESFTPHGSNGDIYHNNNNINTNTNGLNNYLNARQRIYQKNTRTLSKTVSAPFNTAEPNLHQQQVKFKNQLINRNFD